MTEIRIKKSDGTEIVKKLTWGIHQELSNYLMEDNALMVIFTDNSVSESILQICLASRNENGEIIESFYGSSDLEVSAVLQFLGELHEYFENFFFQNQQRIAKTQQKIQELQAIKS